MGGDKGGRTEHQSETLHLRLPSAACAPVPHSPLPPPAPVIAASLPAPLQPPSLEHGDLKEGLLARWHFSLAVKVPGARQHLRERVGGWVAVGAQRPGGALLTPHEVLHRTCSHPPPTLFAHLQQVWAAPQDFVVHGNGGGPGGGCARENTNEKQLWRTLVSDGKPVRQGDVHVLPRGHARTAMVLALQGAASLPANVLHSPPPSLAWLRHSRVTTSAGPAGRKER